jgi:acyl-CoA hydrolase
MDRRRSCTLLYYSIRKSQNRYQVHFEINFVNSAKQGDIIEIGIEVVNFGRTSLTLSCEVRNKMTHQTIITIDKIVFVSLDENGNPQPHGKTEVEYVEDRLGKG